MGFLLLETVFSLGLNVFFFFFGYSMYFSSYLDDWKLYEAGSRYPKRPPGTPRRTTIMNNPLYFVYLIGLSSRATTITCLENDWPFDFHHMSAI